MQLTFRAEEVSMKWIEKQSVKEMGMPLKWITFSKIGGQVIECVIKFQ